MASEKKIKTASLIDDKINRLDTELDKYIQELHASIKEDDEPANKLSQS